MSGTALAAVLPLGRRLSRPDTNNQPSNPTRTLVTPFFLEADPAGRRVSTSGRWLAPSAQEEGMRFGGFGSATGGLSTVTVRVALRWPPPARLQRIRLDFGGGCYYL